MHASLLTDLSTLSPVSHEETEALPAPSLSTVEDIMAREVLAVRPDTSLQTVAEVLLEHSISGLPVVDEQGRVVGMLSKTDLVRQHLDEEGEDGILRLPSGHHLLEGTTAEEVMTRQVLTLPEGTSLTEAAKLMVNAGIHRVPVVSAGGALVGLLSTSDIVRWVAGLP